MESLNPLHTREGIEEMKLLHADLIRSMPWNQREWQVLGSRVWGENMRGGELEQACSARRGRSELVGVRERGV